MEKASNDHRPESHKIFIDTIECESDSLSTKNGWRERIEQLDQIPIFDSFAALELARTTKGTTLGLLRPSSIAALDVTRSDTPDWTQGEKDKLVQHEKQSGLFDDADAKRLATLKKVPFDFHYRYVCGSGINRDELRHKIADWEAGALYWNCRRSKGNAWEAAFRERLEVKLPESDLMFLMGTIHRFPQQWLIVSLIYPPKLPTELERQGSLFSR